jgi:hypothetical protein
MTFPRVRAMILVAVLFVTAGVVVLTAINRDRQTQPKAATCPAGAIRMNVTLPAANNEVTLNVYNGTSHKGLADQISGEFLNRGFQIGKVDVAPNGEQYAKIAKITFGPDGFANAWLLKAYFLTDEAEMVFDDKRTGADIDVTLGAEFQALATSTEVNQGIAANGEPKLKDYPGTCAAKV